MTASSNSSAVLVPEQVKYFISKVIDRRLSFNERTNYKHVLDEIKRSVDLAIIDYERDTQLFKKRP